MDGTAIVVCDGLFATANAKTAHGLVRGTERYRILAVIDAPTAGRDAGEVLDGQRARHPGLRLASPRRSRRSADDARLLRRGRRDLRRARHAGPAGAARARPSTPASRSSTAFTSWPREDPGAGGGGARGAASRSTTSGRPRPRSRAALLERRDRVGRARRASPSSAPTARVGKRTTARFLRDACRRAGMRDRADLHGPDRLDAGRAVTASSSTRSPTTSSRASSSTPSCPARARRAPDLILLEGQSALRNPSGPCGSEFMLSGGARGVDPPARPGPRLFRRRGGAGLTDSCRSSRRST